MKIIGKVNAAQNPIATNVMNLTGKSTLIILLISDSSGCKEINNTDQLSSLQKSITKMEI